MLYDVLSIWELAHRWHEHDPNTSDPEYLPFEVQDTLRFLTRKMANHDLSACSIHGKEYWIAGDMMDFETYWEQHTKEEEEEERIELTDTEEWDMYEKYVGHFTRRLRQQNMAVEGFEQCFEQRIYNRKLLDQRFVLQHCIERLCAEEGLPLPPFWFPDPKTASKQGEDTSPMPSMRPSKIHKL
ncbi:MAG TPA: hypothetical protein EYN73_10210, partial [Chromatiaceae bacterium]|nr:hypothetical protein [Chromatiaceae bacterium]